MGLVAREREREGPRIEGYTFPGHRSGTALSNSVVHVIVVLHLVVYSLLTSGTVT